MSTENSLETFPDTNACLAAAFADRPGWQIEKREHIPSFQQYLERVHIVWSEENRQAETVFVRVYEGLMSWWTLPTLDLPEREQIAWRLAASAGVPVPATLWNGKIGDSPAAVQRLSPGTTVYGLEACSEEVVRQLARTLARVHSAQVTNTDHAHLPDVTLPALFSRFTQWTEEVGSVELRGRQDEMRRQFAAEITEMPAVFLHGDFHGGNVLIENDQVSAVLDWEEAAWGDPRWDVALMFRSLQRRTPTLAPLFVAEYEKVQNKEMGPLEPWLEFGRVRGKITGLWVQEMLRRGVTLPLQRADGWLEWAKH